MSHLKSSRKQAIQEKSSAWNEAIKEAKSQIKELRKAVKTFTKHRDAGDEWPGFKRTVGNAATN